MKEQELKQEIKEIVEYILTYDRTQVSRKEFHEKLMKYDFKDIVEAQLFIEREINKCKAN